MNDYEGLVRQATSDFNAGDWSEAHALFEQAHRLQPNARTLRALGIASFELRRYVRAVSELSAALAQTQKPLTADQVRDTQALLVRAERYVSHVRVELSPAGASLAVDGEVVTGPALALDPGERRLSARAEGFQDAELTLQVEAGANTSVALRLTPLVAAQSTTTRAVHADPLVAARPAPARDAPALGTQRWIAIGAAGLGVVAIAIGTGFGLTAIARHDRAERACPGDCADQHGVELWSQARSAGNVSTAAFIVGGIGLAGGALLWLTAPGVPAEIEIGLGPGALQLRGRL